MEMKKISLFLSLAFTLFFMSSAVFAQTQEEKPLSGEAQISSYTLEPHKPFTLEIKLHLPEGYRAYSDKFKLEIESTESFSFKNFVVSPLHDFYDENAKKTKHGMIKEATLVAPIEAPASLPSGENKLHISLSYQACTASFCLFPTKLNLEVPFEFKSSSVSASTETPKESSSFFDLSFDNALKKGLAWTFFITFMAGFFTSLTPCIFPMIPITVAVLGRHAHLHSKRKNFLLSILYVLGISVTYAAAGVFAAATGSMFGSLMGSPYVIAGISLIFLAMALSMFGLYELQPPAFLRKRLSGDLHVHGYNSAFIYGIIAGVVASPCVGPVLVGILTFVAKSQNLWLGFWLLFVFAIGMGILFLVIGFSSQATKLLPKSGQWMNYVKYGFGILLLLASFNYARLLVPKPVDSASIQTKQVLNWIPYTEIEFEKAKKLNKPIFIDSWADWCGACMELEQKTFSTPEFQAEAKKFTLFKIDFTQDNEIANKARDKYKIIGLPNLLILNSKGEWLQDLTTTEYIEAKPLVEKMRKALQ